MRYDKCVLFVSISSVVSVGAFAAFQSLQVKVNGQGAAQAIEQNGEVYIPLSSLKAGGAEVTRSATGVSVRFLPYPGAVQLDAVEGQLDEWLSNGLWRVRFSNLRFESGVWKITVESANATSQKISMAAIGFIEWPKLYGTTNNELSPTGSAGGVWAELSSIDYVPASIQKRDLAWFGSESDKPSKLILAVKPPAKMPTGLKYPVAKPSFRILIKQ